MPAAQSCMLMVTGWILHTSQAEIQSICVAIGK